MSKTDVRTTIKPNLDLQEPPNYKVIYLNDDVTTMEFVVGSLIDYFSYTTETAIDITTSIHEQGSAVVAVLPYEIAEQKEHEVTTSARNAGYPLKVKIESEAL